MAHGIKGLYTGAVLGAGYYLTEFAWNLFVGQVSVEIIPLIAVFLLYVVSFGLSASIVSLIAIRRDGNHITIKLAWINSAIAASFLGGLFLVSRALFTSSSVKKGVALVLFILCVFILIFALYRFLSGISRNYRKQQYRFIHYAGLVAFNIFFITCLKINHHLRTSPWSVDNLLMDAGALAGTVIVAITFIIFYRIVKERTGKPGAMLSTVFIVIISLMLSGVFFKERGGSEVSGSSDESFRPVILITLDTVRADHLSVYGYNRITSPNIDKFSEDGIVFENTVCQVPITRPSHFSILTGRYPSSHGLTDNFSITPEDVPLLSEHMTENGYTSAAFVSAAVFDSSFNTNFGFQEYFDTIVNNFFSPHFVFVADLYYMGLIDIKNENSAAETNQVVFKWLEKNGNKQFFIWLHYFDPHTPYTPPERFKNMYTDKDFDIDKYYDYDWEKEHYNTELKEVVLDEEIVKHAVDLYDAEIRSMDEELGKLFNELRRLNVYEKSLIIVTADHGESFEHGYYFDHGDRLYEGLIRVPFILKLPGKIWKGEKINTQVETVDIAPTVLEILSISPLQGIEGKSLVGLMSKEEEEDSAGNKSYAYSQTPYRGGYYFKAKELQSIRSNDWKLIYDVRSKEYELFNLHGDPAEKNDVAASQIAARRELELALSKFNNTFRRKVDKTKKVDMDQTTLKQIKSLGYVR